MPVVGRCWHHYRPYCCYNNAQPIRAAPRTQQSLGAPLGDPSAITCPAAQVRGAQPGRPFPKVSGLSDGTRTRAAWRGPGLVPPGPVMPAQDAWHAECCTPALATGALGTPALLTAAAFAAAQGWEGQCPGAGDGQACPPTRWGIIPPEKGGHSDAATTRTGPEDVMLWSKQAPDRHGDSTPTGARRGPFTGTGSRMLTRAEGSCFMGTESPWGESAGDERVAMCVCLMPLNLNMAQMELRCISDHNKKKKNAFLYGNASCSVSS